MRATGVSSRRLVILLPPEISRRFPITLKDVFAFIHFGWDILDDLREVGFSDAKALSLYG